MTETTKRKKRKPEERPAPPPNAISYTLFDASRVSGLSEATLRRREKERLLRMFRCGGRRLVDGASLRRMLGAGA